MRRLIFSRRNDRNKKLDDKYHPVFLLDVRPLQCNSGFLVWLETAFYHFTILRDNYDI